MQLIAVVMGAPNRDTRNEIAKKLLDFGFASYSVARLEARELEPLRLLGGLTDTVRVGYGEFSAVIGKGKASAVEKRVTIPENLTAPVKAGDVVGEVEYLLDGEVIGKVDVTALEDADKIAYLGVLLGILKKALLL